MTERETKGDDVNLDANMVQLVEALNEIDERSGPCVVRGTH